MIVAATRFGQFCWL